MTLRHTYRELAPAAPLRPFVECYWHATSENSPGFRPIELLVPDLRVELIFNAGEPYLWAPDASDPLSGSARASCIGMRAAALAIRQPGQLEHFAIRFRAHGLSAFVATPLQELTQRCVAISDACGRGFDELERRMLGACSVSARVAIADEVLLGLRMGVRSGRKSGTGPPRTNAVSCRVVRIR